MAIPTRTSTQVTPTSAHSTSNTVVGVEQTDNHTLSLPARRVLAALRITFGFTFLWAFLDKTFGLGFATPTERALINGGDPTKGFLSNSEGTFGAVFQSLTGQFWVSPMFMLGLLGIGIALIAGIGLRIAAGAGALLYGFMYLASLPLTTNPIIDDHLSGALILVLFALAYAGDTWGLGSWWKNTTTVKRHPILR